MFIPDTEVRLLSNVPLSPNNEHQMTFPDKASQTSFFYNKGTAANTFSDFTYVKVDSTVQVPRGRDELYSVNYLMFRNEYFTDKWFYAFVTKLEYVNPNMTKIHFKLDVYQTWQFDLTFKPSYVVREHRNRWNADGSPVVNTVDEGLDYGSEYETVKVEQYVPFNDVFFLVIVSQKRMDVNSKEIEPNVNGSIQPLTYYVHPFKLSGAAASVTVDGMNQTLSPVDEVLKALYTSTEAVGNIAALYITEYIGHESLAFQMTEFEPVNIQDSSGVNFVTLRVKKMAGYRSLEKNFGNKYSGFTSVTESKLLMHPYTVTILTDLKGNHQEIKNEYIKGQDLRITTKGSIGTSNKVSYNVTDYLIDSTIINSGEVSIENAIINNSPNDVPVITDLLAAYLQGNRNQLENQKNSIVYNGVMGTLSSAMGGIGQAMARNPVGAVGAVGGMMNSSMSAYFQIAGLNAKQKDLSTMPPQLSKMGGNTAYDYGNGIKGLYIVKKQITPEYQKKLGDFFKMFGYKINELKIPNIKTRQHFNFVQTSAANIVGNIPHDDLVQIKDMFNKGVTLWHGDWLGDYSLSNGEV